MKYILLILVFSFFTVGCHSPSSFNTTTTQALVTSKQLKAVEIQTPAYTLKAWKPKKYRTHKLRVYIEGDGRAWLKRGIPSINPTPVNRLVHNLMMEDPYTDVAYLGRPCQYIMTQLCNPSVWTFGRYDSTALESINRALDYLKQSGSYQELELVGYSGGATLALLSAAHRNDVTSMWTLAGNLDPHFTNAFHKVAPMLSAMNPLDFQERLNHIPQLHFYGSKDSVIPYAISRHYLKELNNTKCISIYRVDGATHSRGWIEEWSKLILMIPECRAKGDMNESSGEQATASEFS